MTKLTRISLLFAFVLGGVLGFSANASAQDKVEDKLIAVFTELSDGIKSADGDCKKVATAMNSWTDKNADKLTELSQKMDDRMTKLSDEQAKAFEEKFTPIIETLMGSAMTCAESEEVQAAFMKLDKVMTASASKDEKNAVPEKATPKE